MIIPELTNSKLNKKKFTEEFTNLLSDEEAAIKQIESINIVLKEVTVNTPPYSLAANLINSNF
jgi:hypothetical protein